MKRFKNLKWGLLSGILVFTAVIAMAQPGEGKGPHHKGHGCKMADSCRAQCMIDSLAKELNLSADQKQKIVEIHKAHSQEMKAIREKEEAEMAKIREQHEQMRAKIEGEVKQVLTEEQKVKYDKIIAEKRPHHKDGPKEKGKCPYKTE